MQVELPRKVRGKHIYFRYESSINVLNKEAQQA